MSTADMTRSLARPQGVTLIEMMSALAIVAVLVTLAMVSHQPSVDKAQSVEAETALAEIRRLETVYHANHGSYSSDLTAIGFTLGSSLKYYKVDLQLHPGGTGYQAMALPLSGSGKQIALRLTQSRDGHTTLEKMDPSALRSFSGSHIPLDQGSDGSNMGSGRSSPKENCRQGGEATVAQDGLLDMNFCLR